MGTSFRLAYATIKLMAKKDRIVKIEYDFIRVRKKEVICLAGFIGCILMDLAAFHICTTLKGALSAIVFSILTISAISIVPLVQYIRIRSARKRDYADAKYIMDHGKKVIGTIKSLKVIKMDQQFTYDIEYEWGEKNELRTVTTPTVVSDKMYITEKDLPLDVIVYVWGKQAYAYAVINPPLTKMKARWARKYIWEICFIVSFIIGIILTNTKHFIIGELICLCTLILAITILSNRRY